MPTNTQRLHDAAEKYHWKGHSWMWDIRDVIGNSSISEVAMVGAHNAATCDISRRSKFGRDAPGPLGKGGVVATFVRLFASRLVEGWSRCQRMSIEDQLMYGIRYIDLRVIAYPSRSTDLYTTHGMISVKLTDVLQMVRRFLARKDSSNEFILLDFQHVFLAFSDPGYSELFRLLTEMKELCVTATVNWTTVPLRELWESKARIFVLMGCDFDQDAAPFIHPRDSFLSSPWKNRNSTNHLLSALSDTPPRTPSTPDSRVFVTQAVLTPNSKTVTQGLFCLGVKPSSVRALAKRSNPNLIKWFWQQNTGDTTECPQHRNVLMLDHPEVCDAEIAWDGGSLRGNVVDICVYINLLRNSVTS